METSLQLSTQKNQFISVDISRESLYEYHTNMIKEGNNNENISIELLQHLGGIDNILSYYLSNDKDLNQDQIQKIYQSLSSNNIGSENTNKNTITTSKSHDMIEGDIITNIFDPIDTYLNHIFGLNIGPKIQQIIYNKLLMTIHAILLMYTIISIFFVDKTQLNGIIFCILDLWFIINLLILIMTVNKIAFELINKSFEFWFKILYAILGSIATLYSRYFTENLSWFFVSMMTSLAEIFAVTLFSMIDGLQWSLKSKTIIGILFTIYYIIWAILDELYLPTARSVVIPISNDIAIEMASIAASAYRVLAIFICKQTIKSMLRKDRATIINYSPFIKWISRKMKSYNIDPTLSTK